MIESLYGKNSALNKKSSEEAAINSTELWNIKKKRVSLDKSLSKTRKKLSLSNSCNRITGQPTVHEFRKSVSFMESSPQLDIQQMNLNEQKKCQERHQDTDSVKEFKPVQKKDQGTQAALI